MKVTAADVEKAFLQDHGTNEKDPAPWVGGIDWDHQHEWEDVPQRSSRSYQDQVCTICGIKQMQAAAPRIPTKPGRCGAMSIASPIAAPIISPIMQNDEKFIIGAPGGVKIEVKMSDIKKELNKRLGLDMFTNNMMKGGHS